MTRARAARPPAELVVAIVLSYVVGIGQILVGIALVFVRYLPDLDGTDRFVVTLIGALTMLLGLLVVSLASGLGRARRDARVLLTALMGVSAALGVYVLVTAGDDVWFRGIDVAITGAVIVVLWTGRVARFFARSDGARTG
ncbi:hypothetical protein LLS1_03060 [Leifsonia sp. LS1]|uniref:hypothetical protein n=1 Tax=Leifsonia sp. LS1 TaxID=2828483 RepID=UPI001CFEBDA4|nr:hypothetical protein [Leifsonia sp. LS1]GIT78637.1 hypothetical protein LLS1_03060 [Leifsonia sp. LS1]